MTPHINLTNYTSPNTSTPQNQTSEATFFKLFIVGPYERRS